MLKKTERSCKDSCKQTFRVHNPLSIEYFTCMPNSISVLGDCTNMLKFKMHGQMFEF